jgi:hypothetical protein
MYNNFHSSPQTRKNGKTKKRKNGKTSWICVALSLIQQRPPPPLALPPQPQYSPLYLLEKINNQKKCMVSQTGQKPEWFFPIVGDLMLSEITVA